MPVTRSPPLRLLLVLEQRGRWARGADVESLKVGCPVVGYPTVGSCVVEVGVGALQGPGGELRKLVFESLVGGVCGSGCAK